VTWIIEFFSEQTDDHLGDVSINAVVADSVEGLLGELPSDLSPDQVRLVAPLFDLEPSNWEYVTRPTTGDAPPVLGWLEMALLYLLSSVTGGQPEDIFGCVFPISRPEAQQLLRRFTSDAVAPDGELFIACAELVSLAQAQAMLEPFAWARDRGCSAHPARIRGPNVPHEE
jgi:hypothetical protein